MIAADKRSRVINARSDMVSRAISFLIITPIFLLTGYRWVVEAMFEEGLSLSSIGWIAINCTGLLVVILGSVFMRGHNNRSALFVEAFFPAIFWAIYLNLGSYLVQIGYHYIAVVLGFALHFAALAYLVCRVKIETKVMFLFGKYIAPLMTKRKQRYQDYAIRSARSKGMTNFQLMLIAIYTINATLWGLMALSLIVVGVVEQVPFFLQTDEPTEKLSYIAMQFYGFDVGKFLLNTVFDWVNSIWAMAMVYFIFNDYVNPDEIGHAKQSVPNHVGHGARELIL